MFMKDLSIIVRHMRTYAEQSLAELDLGFPEQIVLMYMSVHDGCNQESIARYLDIDKGAIAKTMNKLEAKGLVARTVNPANKREKLVSLTDAANGVLSAMADRYDAWAEEAFCGIDEEDLSLVMATVARIAENSSSLASSKPPALAPQSEQEKTSL